ncbi:Icc-related predicted phosphoesterase [Natronocella acetinitrilica]|uniref:Icc-related predicted phosphoesterase n=1 Tax=Natronocella acetinitrilica TaxID=414046 RepID=A0AAE3G3Q3_9GAMM|nr:metallophosphoesterase [Natronocella acetinitrilica]MCP1674618.1 Icc-related predicted phosphoesterase [Natronocella acetinitrilica]
MKLWILSDLHLEFGDCRLVAPEAFDVIVLAGDINVGTAAEPVLRELAALGRPLVYVLGNHEFYQGVVEEVREAWRRIEIPGVHVLDDTACVIDGVRFLGTTLWTDVNQLDYFTMRASGDLSDFQVVRVRGADGTTRALTPVDTFDAHQEALDFLANAFETPFAGKTVVVTHHAPSEHSAAARWRGTPLQPYFSSRLEPQILDWQPALWVHGHMHDSADYLADCTRVVCNPRGYVGHAVNPTFDPALVVTI